MRTRLRIRVEGIVQGVGFRPCAYALTTRLSLGGCVSNDSQGVLIEAEGEQDDVEWFLATLEREAPPLAVIERVTSHVMPPQGDTRFVIVPSHRGLERNAFVSPDVATCADCLHELFASADRRYQYALTNCTNCGPRFTIIRDVPYDRATTTMAAFPICQECAREYHDPTNRRFHAEPVACRVCGPRLTLLDAVSRPISNDPIAHAAALLHHPEYLSTKWALDQEGVELCGVQHHHAHVASCLADNAEEGPVIGVAFDGLGYGTDGTLQGEEFLVADLVDFERVGHLATVAMPGGMAAIKKPWRMAAVYLEEAFGHILQPCR